MADVLRPDHIQQRISSVAGEAPPVLLEGEVAVNLADELIYVGKGGVKPPMTLGAPSNGATASASITVGTVTTGAAGTAASVVNSGTAAAAIFDFAIPRGDAGANGANGTNGVDGANGTNGVDGAAATIAVGTVATGAAGSLASVRNVGTSLAAVFDFVIPQGAQGIQGVSGGGGDGSGGGTAATIGVGTVTTGAPGSSAAVTNSGTISAATLNFTIPRGDTGAPGTPGTNGTNGTAATIGVGTVTTGAAGSSATVTNSGTSSAATLNFTIPRGDAGTAGTNGTNGTAATVSIGNVTTGAPGSPATVTNTGTPTAAVLAFAIPQGAAGTNGTNGTAGPAATISVGTVTTGAAGSSASVTNSGTSSAAVLNFTIPRGDTGAGGTGGGGTGTKTFATFTPRDNQPPAAAFATINTRNSVLVLEFDTAIEESSTFVGVIPEAANLASGLTVRIWWMAKTATAGSVQWAASLESSGTSLDADSFGAAAEATSAANATSGIETVAQIAVAAVDGLAAGGRFRLRISRKAASDDMAGDAQLVAVEVRGVV